MKTKTKHKVDISAKLKAKEQMFNLMVGYDPILETEVRNILKNNKIETKITTECYFYMKGLTKEEAKKVGDLVKNVKFEFKSPKNGNLKVYKVRYISATKAPEAGLGKIKRLHKRKVKGTIHSAGSKSTNYEKKVAERVKKACKYLERANKKKPVVSLKTAKSRRISKPIQQKLNLAA